jgi:hypothetical protein
MLALQQKKENSQKRKQMQRTTKKIRQIERNTVNQSRPRQDPESPLRR